jgi:DNA invertase Pin-like site-specific DNA recombinase
MPLTALETITPQHRDRHAYIYIRQSTPKQVRENRASQENQYALVERARALGWLPHQIHVIDDDLGTSGRDRERSGFQALVAAVSLGQVGIILAFEASRLARNNADWYTLLDLAALVGTLIADGDGIFDPRCYNDRLLLGLRGMLSEAELHLLRLRMDSARQRQIAQGSYRQLLPTGLLRLDDGRVVKDPDQQIQHAIELVFSRFARLGSCTKVLRSFRDDGLLLPRRQTGGLHAGQLLWRLPTTDAIYEILCNPAYAGAFVFGRTGPPPQRRPGQRARSRRRPMVEWTAVHHNVYPAYITWEQFMANQQHLADNASNYQRRMRGTARPGAALLAGLVVCGHCGRQMRATYKPKPRYVCTALGKSYGGPTCLHLEGAGIEEAVVAAFFAALAPAELDLLDEVLAAQQQAQSQLRRQHAEQVARAEYEVALAQRQYLAVDPDNRLVAAELERRWEAALQALAAARERAAQVLAQLEQPSTLEPALRAQLRELGPRMPELWTSGRLSSVHKKELLRSLIRRIIVKRPVPARIELQIVWVSGAWSRLTVQPGLQRTAELEDYARLVERVRALSSVGYDDGVIAERLAAEGFRSARTERLSKELVGKLRRRHQIVSVRTTYREQDQIDGQWTVGGLIRRFGVKRARLYEWIERGVVPARQHPETGQYLIPDDPDVLAALQARSVKEYPRVIHVEESGEGAAADAKESDAAHDRGAGGAVRGAQGAGRTGGEYDPSGAAGADHRWEEHAGVVRAD